MIEAVGLTRRFGALVAVADLNLAVPAGSILALLGPNGAGKTTTVRMLAALLAPTAGEGRVAGYDIRREPDAVRASVGLVTDVPGLYEQMPVEDYLAMFATIYGIPRAQQRARIAELLAFFDLEAHRSQRMVSFSKGMKQKAALARALIHEPPVLFLDEPTAGLDPLAARAVRELILSRKHAQRSIILCTHDLDEAERLADEVAIMRLGRIVARAAPAVLRQQAASGTQVQVEFATPWHPAPETLDGIAGLAELRYPDDGHLSGAAPVLSYCTAQPRVVNPLVLARLVAAGAPILSVTCVAPTLEDVYARAIAGEE